ncbi:double zinc ribbon domain-containing protein [Leptolyngbya sp. AN02str]|uniref:double zinc ribbon domain-containing protein n=1 Tax=Leptolyngbya sp. AN02str TaxID=3423363 RepID=UPI003D319626
MSECPRCHQPVDVQAIACPHCRTPLKAYGHPGMPLYRATTHPYLCPSCVYHLDDTCNFPKRPQAKECTLYRDVEAMSVAPAVKQRGSASTLSLWLHRHKTLMILAGLVIVSLAIALSQR